MTNWDEKYLAGIQVNDDPHPLVVEFASTLKPARALDLACGVGRHALWLAERGWYVTAVDSSRAGMDILQQRAREKGLALDARLADLERREFVIEPDSYELIVVCHYLQRDLFPMIKAGLRMGGALIAIIAMVDDDPGIKPMNPDYLLKPGELSSEFEGWELIRNVEGKPAGDKQRRAMAELIARRIY
jgi:SAM-dependent methyltransferase